MNKIFKIFVRGMLLILPGLMQAQPNIIIVLSDDQGYAHLGAFRDQYDPQGMNQTFIEAANACMPTVDRLAEEGVRFLNCHAAPTCFPSRTMLMSSKYPQSQGVYSNLDMWQGGPDPSVIFPVKALQQAGYATAAIGKWHLGRAYNQHPNSKGFDYYFGFNSAQTEKYNSTILYRNRSKTSAIGFLADQVTDEATNFIRATNGAPFFLYLCYNDPHGPRPAAPSKYLNKFNTGSSSVNNLYAYINAVDTGIDSVLSAVNDIGQENNTILFFASDNGPTDGMPDPSAGDLRWYKRSLYEGGVRVPAVAWWPGNISAGQTNTDLISFMDVMPTMLDAVGVALPSEENYDGKSFLRRLTELRTDTFRTGPLFWAGDSYPDSPAWKDWWKQNQIDHPEISEWAMFPPGWFVIQDKWKLIDDGFAGEKLYNLKTDISETTDLFDDFPGIVEALRGHFRDYIQNKPPPYGWDTEKWEKFFRVGEDPLANDTIPVLVAIRLIDQYTGNPISNARIQLDSTKETTGADGNAEFVRVRKGMHLLSLFPEHHKELIGRELNIISDTLIEITLERTEYRIDLEVKDQITGTGILNSLVRFNGQELGTDITGKLQLRATYGTYTLSVSHPYYMPFTGKITVESDTIIIIDVLQTLADLQFKVYHQLSLLEHMQITLGQREQLTNENGLTLFQAVPVYEEITYSVEGEGYARYEGNLVLHTDTLVIVRMDLTGTGIVDKYNDVRIYPNPAAEELVLAGCARNISFIIRSIEGRELIRNKISIVPFRLDISRLSSGLYILELGSPGNIFLFQKTG